MAAETRREPLPRTLAAYWDDFRGTLAAGFAREGAPAGVAARLTAAAEPAFYMGASSVLSVLCEMAADGRTGPAEAEYVLDRMVKEAAAFAARLEARGQGKGKGKGGARG